MLRVGDVDVESPYTIVPDIARPENYRVLNHIFTFLSYGRLKFYHLLLIHVLSHLVGLMLQVINMGKMFDTHIIIVLINEGVCF